MASHQIPRAHRTVVVTRPASFLPDLARRLALVLLFIGIATPVLWSDRGGLSDNAHPGRPLTLLDVSHYTVVTLITVGHGDIVPSAGAPG